MGIPIEAGYGVTRRGVGAGAAAAAARSRLILWLAMLALGLSLLAMHQLSSNHTAADPASGDRVGTVTADDWSQHAAGHTGDAGPDRAHTLPALGGTDLVSGEHDGCPGCAGHTTMALTCLAALVLLTAGLLLPRPRTGRGILRPRPNQPAVPRPRERFRPRPLSPVEMSISRT